MTNISKTIMFLSSYSPLYLLLLVSNYLNNVVSRDIKLYIILLIVLVILPNIFLCYIMKITSDFTELISISQKNISSGDKKILRYIPTYIISFIFMSCIRIESIRFDMLIVGILIQIILCYLYCKFNMIYTNPILRLFYRYRIYIIKGSHGNIIILSKNKSKLKEKYLKVNCFDNKVYILK